VFNGRVRLVLWDIDLTLVDYSGIGRRWYQQALRNLFDVDMRHLPEFPGRTERSLTLELLTAHGMAGDERSIQRMFAELIRLAEAARPDMTSLGRARPRCSPRSPGSRASCSRWSPGTWWSWPGTSSRRSAWTGMST
jgi:phosphoglycolate phosphatase-like HAD superfamily hydrolase